MPGVLGVGPDRGQRRAQLVAGVGDELAQPVLGGVAGGERGPYVLEHVVEGDADLVHLAGRVGRPDAGRQHRVGIGEGQLGDVQRGRGHPFQRPQGAPDDDGRGHPAGHHESAEHDGLDHREPSQGLVHRVQRQPGDLDVTIRHRPPPRADSRRRSQIRADRPAARNQGRERGRVRGRERERPVGAVVGDHRGLGDPAVEQPDADGPDRLARYGVVGVAVVPARRELAVLEAGGEPTAGGRELAVELAQQERAQEHGGGRAEDRAGQQEDADQPDGEPAAQRPVRPPPRPGADRRHDGGRRM